MSILAIIPARSGSKRVPGKNTKILAGKPLIAHTINAAQHSLSCDEIMVSTDSQEIADISLHYGASVPWLRDSELATDSADVIHTIIDVLTKYKNINIYFDSVLLLQPTSPFRKSETIKKAVDLHIKSGLSVVSVDALSLKLSWCRTIDDKGHLIKPDFAEDKSNSDFPETIYKLNGSIYIASTEHILSCQSLYTNPTKSLVLDSPNESIDIDTKTDWALAEKLIELKEEVLL